MATYPLFFKLLVHLGGENLVAVARSCLGAMVRAGMPPVQGWAIPSDSKMHRKGLEDALTGIESRAGKRDYPVNAAFDLGGGIVASVYRQQRARVEQFALRVRQPGRKVAPEAMARFLVQAADVCRGLLDAGNVTVVELIREGGGVSAIPHVPLVPMHSHLVLADVAAVADAYERPETFWNAGWDTVEEFGGKRLLSRGLDTASGTDYLAQILPHQWEMARAAKPGRTRYYLPQPEPEEMAVYHAGEPYLNIVGHLAAGNVVEFSCNLPAGEHIRGWEIFNLWDLIQEAALPDGRKVETIRIVFLDKWAAEQEKRPLLDIGARVYYYGVAGQLVEITN